MTKKFSVLDAFIAIEKQIRQNYEPCAAQPRINELKTVRNRFLASGWKGAPVAAGAKMTAAESQKAERFLARLPIHQLLTASQTLQRAFELMRSPSPAATTTVPN